MVFSFLSTQHFPLFPDWAENERPALLLRGEGANGDAQVAQLGKVHAHAHFEGIAHDVAQADEGVFQIELLIQATEYL